VAITLGVCVAAACNPFYSVEQSDVERGYRFLRRGEFSLAISTFQRTLGSYPNSGLAHLGLADGFSASGRELDAIDMYTRALPLFTDAPRGEQTIGKKTFSYQNQGLTFPYGVAAYIHFHRGLAYEALAKKHPDRRNEYVAAAKSDYTTADTLAPTWHVPRERLKCFEEPTASNCK
jgi:tetratricopeptide (TPR) repeat protein